MAKKRVALEFTVDVCDGYDDFEFMRDDFMGELSCCVNSPDEDSFEMVVEDIKEEKQMEKQEKRLKIFISGPMKGYPNWNKEAFDRAEKRLRELGYDVFNPSWMQFYEGWSHEEIRAIDLDAIEKCDAIAQLDGWQESIGAQEEFEQAKRLHKKIFMFVSKYGDLVEINYARRVIDETGQFHKESMDFINAAFSKLPDILVMDRKKLLKDAVTLVETQVTEEQLAKMGLEPACINRNIALNDTAEAITSSFVHILSDALDGELRRLLVDTVNMKCYYFEMDDGILELLLKNTKELYTKGYTDGVTAMMHEMKAEEERKNETNN